VSHRHSGHLRGPWAPWRRGSNAKGPRVVPFYITSASAHIDVVPLSSPERIDSASESTAAHTRTLRRITGRRRHMDAQHSSSNLPFPFPWQSRRNGSSSGFAPGMGALLGCHGMESETNYWSPKAWRDCVLGLMSSRTVEERVSLHAAMHV